MRKRFSALLLLIMLLCMTGCSEKTTETLTYAVYPYLPDTGYYQEIIESRWEQVHPDIKLIRAEWDCYTDDKPENIDVIMFDAVMRDKLVDACWIQPIDPNAVEQMEDIFPFALEGLTVGGRVYGIPVFLCGNFLIYDQDCEALDAAEHMTDLADMSEILVVNSEFPANRDQYIMEVLADTLSEANPSVSDMTKKSDSMALIDRLAISDHKNDDDTQVTEAYDSGIGQGYIGFSESMRFLHHRRDQTRIKSVSFSDRENIPRLYEDAAAVTAGVKGQRYDRCLELMNIMAKAEVLTELSVKEGAAQYLMLARKSPYQQLARQFPLYGQIEELAEDEENHIILTP